MPAPTRGAAKRLYQAAAMLSFSVLADSLLEHYRGCFANRAMFIAPVVSALSLAESSRAAISRDNGGGAVRKGLFGAAVLTGMAGLGFHLYNVVKREGGFGWHNLFYAAPIGAPGALSMAGLFGLAAELLEHDSRQSRPISNRAAGRGLAALSAFGLLGTMAEVLLLHFRGAFQDPIMYVPLIEPPVAGLALAAAAIEPTAGRVRAASVILKSVGAMGVAGAFFHSYGIQRNMGGWRNWRQMVLQGPPVPAPPGFTGIALAGLGALALLTPKERS
ncbi:MAG: hypothetical protein WAO07_01700 [Desulfobacterales bacterium]